MVGLLALAPAAKIIIKPTCLLVLRAIINWFVILALPASDHRHGVDGGQAIKHTLHDGSSHPITTKALSCIIRIN
jgi:hypothetical protein